MVDLDFRGVRIGAPVCEDIWTDEVTECLAECGAELIIVPNGSPFDWSKTDVRMNIAVEWRDRGDDVIVELGIDDAPCVWRVEPIRRSDTGTWRWPGALQARDGALRGGARSSSMSSADSISSKVPV